jgi:acetyltransferase-like isoleucine patch superfamily enzyme/acyl carrier protein
MSETAVDQVREVVLEHLGTRLEAKGLAATELRDDFDFLAAGLIDSFGLLELIGWVETKLGLTLDFEHIDVGSLTVLGPFCRHVAAQLDGASGDGPSAATEAETAEVWEVALTAPTARSAAGLRRALGRFSLRLHGLTVRARGKLFSLRVAGGFAAFGSHTVLQLPIRLSGESRMAIGSDVFVGSGSWLQALDEGESPVAIEIGDGTSVAGLCILSAVESIRIGRRVSFARNVYVADHAHAYDRSTAPIMDQGITDVASVEIGDGAWIGENVVILPGSRIGHGSAIGANSVVNGDIPPFSLALGSPARVIRRFASSAAPAAENAAHEPSIVR